MLLLSLAHSQSETYLRQKEFDSSQLCQVTCAGLNLQPNNVHHPLFDLAAFLSFFSCCAGETMINSPSGTILRAQVLEKCNKKDQREKKTCNI